MSNILFLFYPIVLTVFLVKIIRLLKIKNNFVKYLNSLKNLKKGKKEIESFQQDLDYIAKTGGVLILKILLYIFPYFLTFIVLDPFNKSNIFKILFSSIPYFLTFLIKNKL